MKTISEFLAKTMIKDKLLFRVGLFFLILFVLLFIPLLIDSREILGINAWIKPMKFALSIGVYLWTIAWYIDYLNPYPFWKKLISRTAAYTMLGEMAILLTQSGRGQASHFNNSTALDGILFGLMGLMIALSTLSVIILLLLLFIKKVNADTITLNAMRIGLALFLLASYIGGIMINNNAHAIGVSDGGPGIPFFNWSTEGGDLRIAHFLGLHALQIIPLFIHWLRSKFSLDLGKSMISLLVFTILFSGLLFFVFWNAQLGRPLVSF